MARVGCTVWGEDMILDRLELVDNSEAVALTYLEVYSLERVALDGVCRQFPECGRRIHAVSRRLMIQRLVVRKMRELAGLPPPRSFTEAPETPMFALPAVTLDQKVDVLIDSSAVASQKLAQLEGRGGIPDTLPIGMKMDAKVHELVVPEAACNTDSAVEDLDASDTGDCQSAPPTEEKESAAARAPVAAVSSCSPAPTATAASFRAPATESYRALRGALGATHSSAESATPPGSSERSNDRRVLPGVASAAASFDSLVAMHQDLLTMQAAMGDELSRLSASLGRRPIGLRLQTGQAANGRSLQMRMAPQSGPPASMRGGVRSPSLEVVEEGAAEEFDWADEARKFLPHWAKPRTACGSPTIDAMSA